MKRKIPISKHAVECLQDLRADYTDHAGISTNRRARGAIELGFLRGYQEGYEDRLMGKKAQHYARSKKEITRDDDGK